MHAGWRTRSSVLHYGLLPGQTKFMGIFLKQKVWCCETYYFMFIHGRAPTFTSNYKSERLLPISALLMHVPIWGLNRTDTTSSSMNYLSKASTLSRGFCVNFGAPEYWSISFQCPTEMHEELIYAGQNGSASFFDNSVSHCAIFCTFLVFEKSQIEWLSTLQPRKYSII